MPCATAQLLFHCLDLSNMPSTARDLTFIFTGYFPGETTSTRVIYILVALVGLWPLWRLHLRQRREPRQPRDTAWSSSVRSALTEAATSDLQTPFGDDDEGLDEPEAEHVVRRIHPDIDVLYEFLGISPNLDHPPTSPSLPPLILCTSRVECCRCGDNDTHPSLRRRIDPQKIQVLMSDLTWHPGTLYAATCIKCNSVYYPDTITFPAPQRERRNERLQVLEYDAPYLRVSPKHPLWVERRVALAQEHALLRFHAGWSSFANWLNDMLPCKPAITNRQSQRLFLEHFARRLLVAHGHLASTFTLPAHCSSPDFASAVRARIGVDGGTLPDSINHSCMECTHLKRYRADLIAEGFVPGEGDHAAVAEVDGEVRYRFIQY